MKGDRALDLGSCRLGLACSAASTSTAADTTSSAEAALDLKAHAADIEREDGHRSVRLLLKLRADVTPGCSHGCGSSCRGAGSTSCAKSSATDAAGGAEAWRLLCRSWSWGNGAKYHLSDTGRWRWCCSVAQTVAGRALTPWTHRQWTAWTARRSLLRKHYRRRGEGDWCNRAEASRHTHARRFGWFAGSLRAAGSNHCKRAEGSNRFETAVAGRRCHHYNWCASWYWLLHAESAIRDGSHGAWPGRQGGEGRAAL